AVVLAPFSVLPLKVASILWVLALAAAVVGALSLCGVRDVRCYLAACACPAVIAGLLYANASLLLVLAVALIWRYRDKSRMAALIGLVVATKVFLWPLLFWLAITRRWRSLWLSMSALVAMSLVGWAAIGFADPYAWVTMIRRHAALNDQDGASVSAL